MRKSTNYELNLLDEDDFYSEELLNENAEKIDEILKEHDTPEYDIAEQKDVEELTSGESLKIALRKLAKAVADYISHKADEVAHITAEERTAWTAKLGAEDIANDTTTISAGKVLDARQGKTLSETIKNLTTTQEGSIQTNINWDTIKVPGLFRYILQASDGIYNAPALNIPFYLVVIKRNDNNLEQWAYSAVSNLHYTRVYASGEWGAWAKVLTNEDIVANLATDRSDMLLAASMGKNLQDQISTLNSNLSINNAFNNVSKMMESVGDGEIKKFYSSNAQNNPSGSGFYPTIYQITNFGNYYYVLAHCSGGRIFSLQSAYGVPAAFEWKRIDNV